MERVTLAQQLHDCRNGIDGILLHDGLVLTRIERRTGSRRDFFDLLLLQHIEPLVEVRGRNLERPIVIREKNGVKLQLNMR